LVFSPIVVLVVALSLGTDGWWKKLGGIALAFGGPLLAAQWGRSAGRRKEPRLWETWDGSPTLKLLRFRTGGPTATVEHRHETVERATGVSLPTEAAELADPVGADAIYEVSIAALRELTRNRSDYPLVFEELCNYGLRRNLWGRKTFGIAVAAGTLVVSIVFLVLGVTDHVEGILGAALSAAFSAVALGGWLLMVTPDWVKETADAYAIRLVESAVRLPAVQRGGG
jgi:hypothetical protein